MRRALLPFVLVLCLVDVAVAQADPVIVTVSECTEAALDAAIDSAPDGATIAFDCDGTIVATANRVLARDVTLDGAGHDVTLDGDDQWRILAINGGVNVTLRDLTLTHGLSQDAFGGGAIFNLGHLVVDRVRFLENHGYNYGGAIYSRAVASLDVVDSLFEANSVTCPADGQGGGAIAVQMRAALTVRGTTFRDNMAAGGAAGGAILGMHANNPAAAGPIEISDSVFEGNAADSDRPNWYPTLYSGGGAVAVYNHALTIRDSQFTANSVSAWGAQAMGGAVWISPSTAPDSEKPALISGSLFQDNVAEGDVGDRPDALGSWGLGGAVATLDEPVTVEASQFLGNTAARGGGLLALSGELSVRGTAILANAVQAGTPVPVGAGGLEVYGTATLADSVVVDNANVNCLAGTAADRTGRIVDGGGNVESPGTSCGFPVAVALPPPPVATPTLDAPATVPAGPPAAASQPPTAPTPAATPAARPQDAASRALGGRRVRSVLKAGECRAFVAATTRETLAARRALLALVLTCSDDAQAVVRARVDLRHNGRERSLRLAGRRLTVRAGEAQVVQLRLTRAQRRILHAGTNARLRVAAAVDGGARRTHTWRVG